MGSKAATRDGWTRVRFGDVVRLSTERCTDPTAAGIDRYVGLEHLEPGDLRIRSWGNVADGVTFTSRFRPGQVLFGKRRAYQRKVAVAEFDGICSSDIYVFEPADDRLLPDLLPFLCQTNDFCEHAVKTSAGSLSPRTNWVSLMQYEFDLPPLAQQLDLVTAAKLASRVESCGRDLEDASDVLRRSMARDLIPMWEKRSAIELVAIEDLVKPDRVPIAVKAQGIYAEIGVRSFGNGVFHKPPTTGATIGTKRVFEVHAHRLILNIIFAWEGAIAVTRPCDEGRIASHRFPQYAARSSDINLDYLAAVLLSPVGLTKLKDISPGGAGRNRTLGQANFLKLPVPVVPLDRQNEIVAALHAIKCTTKQAATHRSCMSSVTAHLLKDAR